METQDEYRIRRKMGIYYECPECGVRKFDPGECIFCQNETTREPGEVYVEN